MTTVGRLNQLATGGGSTTRLFTQLSQAPSGQREMHLSLGSPQLSMALPNPSATRLFTGDIPTALLEELKQAGLLFQGPTQMQGVYGTEIHVLPPGTLWIEPFLGEM